MPRISICVNCATLVALPRNAGTGNSNDALIQRYISDTFPPWISMTKHTGDYQHEISYEDQNLILHIKASYSSPLSYLDDSD